MTDVYITGFGKFLPNSPIDNSNIESVIGKIHNSSSRLGKMVLRKNGIKSRHYALDSHGKVHYTNSQMAALAITKALEFAQLQPNDISYLASSTTLGDIIVPGFASQVHQQLKAPPMEVASFQSVCASGVMALKSAFAQIKANLHSKALVSGSEFSSRWFRPGFYESIIRPEDAEKAPFDLEFLRWTLSDGAGAVVLENNPHPNKVCLKIEWIELKSYADRFEPCMYAGTASNKPSALKSWGHYPSPAEAYQAGALALKQDFTMLYEMFPIWASFYIEMLEKHQLDVDSIDYFLPHYSAESLGNEMEKLLQKSGSMIPREKWFNNLKTCGNTGSASIYIMLEELINKNELHKDQKILCFVPESGQCIASFFLLTVG